MKTFALIFAFIPIMLMFSVHPHGAAWAINTMVLLWWATLILPKLHKAASIKAIDHIHELYAVDVERSSTEKDFVTVMRSAFLFSMRGAA